MTEDARMTQERVAHLASELETSRTECTSLRGERDATRFTLESVKSAAKDEVDALRDSLRSERGRVEEARTRLASVDALKARNSKLEERERVLSDQLRDALGDVMRFKERARDAASFAASMNGAFFFIFVRAIGLTTCFTLQRKLRRWMLSGGRCARLSRRGARASRTRPRWTGRRTRATRRGCIRRTIRWRSSPRTSTRGAAAQTSTDTLHSCAGRMRWSRVRR